MIRMMKGAAFLCVALFAGSAAFADHERIVTPDTGTSTTHSRVHPQTTAHVQSQRHSRTHSSVQPRVSGPYVTPYLAGGIGTGGDVIGRFQDNFGDVERVRGGGGFFVEGGLLMAVDTATRLRMTGGYEIDEVSRGNGRSTFDRLRFDLMLLRSFGPSELGVGLTAHTSVGYRCDINSICAGDVEFDDAIGFTAEYALTTPYFYNTGRDRRVNPLRGARLGLRFTDIEYRAQLNSVTATESNLIDGKSLSAFIGFSW